MKCTNNNCPLIGGLTYVHVECFERLQEELVAIVAKTGTKCKLWVVSTEVKLGPGQDWSRQQRRNFLWNWRGLKLVHKYLRCRCGKGLTMLDRDAWEVRASILDVLAPLECDGLDLESSTKGGRPEAYCSSTN